MITTAHVWTTVFIHVGVILAVIAYFTVGAAMLPRMTERAAKRLAARPLRTTLLGVIVSLPWAIAAIALMQAGGPLGALGVVLGLSWVLLGLVGGAALARHIGQTGDDWRRVARGGTLIALTWVLPLIGWLFVMPLTLATGIGCLIAGLRRELVVTPPPAPVAVPSAVA